MLSILILLVGLVSMPDAFALQDEPQLILNAPDIEMLPPQFRTCEDAYRHPKAPPRQGLEKLRLSGSAQFSQSGLSAILKRVSARPLFIVDLRQEFHGFLNGNAVSWFVTKDWINRDKTGSEIAGQEKLLFKQLQGMKQVPVTQIQRKSSDGGILQATQKLFPVIRALEESTIVEAAGVGYLRLYLTDHMAPSSQEIDRFLSFYRTLPPNSWLHVHCAGGDGRTTSLMAIVDMFHHAMDLSFEDIIARQHALGGSNLAQFGDPLDWKYHYAKERLAFLQKFYEEVKR